MRGYHHAKRRQYLLGRSVVLQIERRNIEDTDSPSELSKGGMSMSRAKRDIKH